MKRIIYFICFVIFGSCTAQKAAPKLPISNNSNSLLWEVSGNGLKQPSYVFGTFHLMCPGDIRFGKPLNQALQYASEVYMELDMDDPSTMLSGILVMNMKGGKKLKDLYSEAEYKRLNDFFKDSIGMPLTMFQSMKPSMLESLLYPKMLACKTSTGVDMEIMKLAQKNKKEIKGLETIQFQSSIFDSIPYENQAKELLKAIDSIRSYQVMFDTMVNVYKSRRIGDMEKMLSKSEFGMEENSDLLLYNRNKNWLGQLKKIMPAESVFVAVGAGHLVGDKGLIALLQKEGYTVRPVKDE